MVYFPSCNFTKASPEAARRIREYMAERMEVAGCCRVDALAYPKGSEAVYFCQACRETLEKRAPEDLRCRNLFEVLVEDPGFPWPDYSGLTATVQDCWRDREHPEIFDAVRAALGKMGVRVIEMEENRERTTFCGNLHIEPVKKENVALAGRYREAGLWTAPEDVQIALMREHAEKYPCETVVAYCNRCKAGAAMGGAKAVHLLELATGTWG